MWENNTNMDFPKVLLHKSKMESRKILSFFIILVKFYQTRYLIFVRHNCVYIFTKWLKISLSKTAKKKL